MGSRAVEGEMIASRVSSGQPSLALAWRTSSRLTYQSSSAAPDVQPRGVRLAQHPGYAVVRPGAVRRLQPETTRSAASALATPVLGSSLVRPERAPT
jgi:hypothetical protein